MEIRPDGVVVRLATEEDLDALVGLLSLLFEQEAEFDAETLVQRRGLESLLAVPDRASVFVAERHGRVLGLVTMQLVLSTAIGGPAGLLEDMMVSPTARGAGVGAALLATAIERAASLGCRRITLLTDADNLGAQDFYGRHGFVRSTMVPMRLNLELE